MRFLKSDRGFTLVEMIGAIAILAIILSVILFNMQAAKEKARDTQRISDLQQIQIALRLYKDTYGKYPCEDPLLCSDIGQTERVYGVIGENSNTITNLLENFISQVPHDPLGPGDSEFRYYFDPLHSCGGMNAQAVLIAKTMETESAKNFDDLPCSSWGAEGGASSDSFIILLGDSSG